MNTFWGLFVIGYQHTPLLNLHSKMKSMLHSRKLWSLDNCFRLTYLQPWIAPDLWAQMKFVTWCTDNGMQQLHSIFNISMVMDMRSCGVSIYLHNLITVRILLWLASWERLLTQAMRVSDSRHLKLQHLLESTAHIDIWLVMGLGGLLLNYRKQRRTNIGSTLTLRSTNYKTCTCNKAQVIYWTPW